MEHLEQNAKVSLFSCNYYANEVQTHHCEKRGHMKEGPNVEKCRNTFFFNAYYYIVQSINIHMDIKRDNSAGIPAGGYLIHADLNRSLDF